MSTPGFHYFMSRTRKQFSNMLDRLPPLTPAPLPSEPSASPAPVTPVTEAEEEPEFQVSSWGCEAKALFKFGTCDSAFC